MRPDVQARIQEEVDAALERHGGFTYQMMLELPYVDKVLDGIQELYSHCHIALNNNFTVIFNSTFLQLCCFLLNSIH